MNVGDYNAGFRKDFPPSVVKQEAQLHDVMMGSAVGGAGRGTTGRRGLGSLKEGHLFFVGHTIWRKLEANERLLRRTRDGIWKDKV